MTKKLIAMLLALAMMLTLVGCSSDNGDTQAATKDSGESQAATTKDSGESQATEPASQEGTEGVEQVLNINYLADPKTWEPYDDVTTTSSNLYLNTYLTLYRSGVSGDEPSGAQSVDINEDGTVYTFHLDPNAKFADGTTIKASDWVYSWQRAIDPIIANDYAWYLCDFVAGAAELNGLSADSYGTEDEFKAAVEEAKKNLGVKAIDDTTLEVTLTSGSPLFVSVVTHPCTSVVSQAFVEGLGDATYGATPETTLCSGPFKLTEWVDDQKIVLTKNENYLHAERVKLETINMSFISESSTEILMYENGELDMTNNAMSTADAASYNGTEEYHIWKLLGSGWIDWNCERYPYDNADVRHALDIAINYEELTTSVIGSGAMPSDKFVPSGMPNPADPSKVWREGEAPLQPTGGDLEGAKALLEKAGWTQGADGTWTDANGQPFPTIEVNFRMGNEGDSNIATAICGYWAQLGIPAIPDPMESALRSEIRPAGNFDCTFAGWGADYADALNFLVCLTSTHYYNYGKWFNDEYDALIKTAQTSFDQNVRYEAMCKAEDIIFQEWPVIQFQFSATGYLQKPYVHGDFRSPLGMLDLEGAYVDAH